MAELETAQSVEPCSNVESVELLDHHFELLDDQVARQEKAPGRAGLPATYHMRHDEHYVDSMLSRPAASPDEAVARPIGDGDVQRARDERIGRVQQPIEGAALTSAMCELAERLGAIESCLDLVSAGDRPFRERVALDLVRAEARRCAWLAEALMVLGRASFIVRTELSANALLERGLALLEPERRLGGIEVGAELMKAPPAIRGDHRMLATALAIAATAVAAIAGRAGAGRIRARVQVDGSRSTALFELSQDQVAVPEWALARLFDPGWQQRPGGAMSGPALAGARRVAELHGGRLDATPAARGGCALTMVVPCG